MSVDVAGRAGIRLNPWDAASPWQAGGAGALFNCPALAEANVLEQHEPLCLEIDGAAYLAYRRNASLVVNALSVADGVRLLGALDKLRDVSRPHGIRAVACNTLNADNDPVGLVRALRMGATLRYEFVIDVADYAASRLSNNHKRNIRKGQKSDAVLRLASTPDAVRAHIELVDGNLQGKGIGGLSNSPAYFQSLLDAGAGMLAQVEEGGVIQATTFFVVNEDTAYYHSSGTTDQGKKLGAAHFLVDQVIEEMRRRGMRAMNLGGSTPDQAGLLRFKQGFKPRLNLLIAASRSLQSGGRQKIRNIISAGGGDLFAIRRADIYRKTAVAGDDSPAHGWAVEQLDGEGLMQAVAVNPGLGAGLEFYYRQPSRCFGLYDDSGALVALAFLQQAEGAAVAAVAVQRIESALLRDRQVAIPRLLDLLAPQAMALGHRELLLRVPPDDGELCELAVSAGFSFHGQEKTLSSSLFGRDEAPPLLLHG